jgi:hypothetical protein
MYEGLQQYQDRARPDPLAQRAGESDEAHRRRIAPLIRHAEDVEQQTWEHHRAVMDGRLGSGSGLLGNATATDRATALGSPGFAFSGDQRVEPNGHMAWEASAHQPGVYRVYADQLGEAPGVSPLLAHLRASGSEWH